MAGLSTWIEASRPKTLSAAVVPVIVGTALARAIAPGTAQLWLGFFALMSVLFIQIGTNFINDAIDFKKGADNEHRIGPRRVTASGLIPPGTVMAGGFACFVLAAMFALPLVLAGGWTIVAIGIASLACGYLYTGGPYPLAYVGLGELFVLLFFGIIAVGGVVFVETGIWDWRALLGGTQIGFLSTVLIAINNLRDASGDRQVRKMTLAARFGKTFGRMEITLLALTPFVLGVLWLQAGFLYAAYLPWAVLPLALRLVLMIFKTEPSPVYNRFLALSSLLQMLFGVLLGLGLLL